MEEPMSAELAEIEAFGTEIALALSDHGIVDGLSKCSEKAALDIYLIVGRIAFGAVLALLERKRQSVDGATVECSRCGQRWPTDAGRRNSTSRR
jgi:hypothetical protein